MDDGSSLLKSASSSTVILINGRGIGNVSWSPCGFSRCSSGGMECVLETSRLSCNGNCC